jgi:hypothetical protein
VWLKKPQLLIRVWKLQILNFPPKLISSSKSYNTGFPQTGQSLPSKPVWPDWAKFRRLGHSFWHWSHYFLKNIAQMISKKSPKNLKVANLIGINLCTTWNLQSSQLELDLRTALWSHWSKQSIMISIVREDDHPPTWYHLIERQCLSQGLFFLRVLYRVCLALALALFLHFSFLHNYLPEKYHEFPVHLVSVYIHKFVAMTIFSESS